MPRPKSDPKTDSLRDHGCLHPHPEKVADKIFVTSEFFDPRDLVQVKYEMLRSVRVDGLSVSCSAASFGLSRPTFYQAQAAFEAGGLSALLRKKSGPRQPHKLSDEVMDVVRGLIASHPSLTTRDLVDLVNERFGISVHVRSIERALTRHRERTS